MLFPKLELVFSSLDRRIFTADNRSVSMGEDVDDGSGSVDRGGYGYRGADDRQGARQGVDSGESTWTYDACAA